MEKLIDRLGKSSGRRNQELLERPSALGSETLTISSFSQPEHEPDSWHPGLFGLFQLWPPEQEGYDGTQLDIVAVHGLNGSPYTTWTDGDKLWLADFLPFDIPQARIFTYGYNSGVAFTESTSRVDDYARTLLVRLVAKRRPVSTEKRPLIFICHSLGGIVVKKALVIAHERSSRYASVTRDTYGIMFFGTPHRGADAAFWGRLLGSLADVLTLGSIRTQLLADLKPKSEMLGSTCSQFVERAQSLGRVFSIYERVKMKGLGRLVVEEDSAVLGIPNEIPIPIEADHRSMCRFSSMKSEEYQMVADCLKEMVEDALQYLGTRNGASIHKDFLNCLKTVDPDEMLRAVSKPAPGTCLWITDTDAFKNWRDQQSIRLLWISGRPGVGKTTIARFLIEHLRRWLQRSAVSGTEAVVAFFFCTSKQWLRNSVEHLARSLLYQILSQNKHLFRYLGDSDMKPYIEASRRLAEDAHELDNPNTTWRLLTIVLQRSPNTTFWILIDALDEFSERARSDLLRRIQSLIGRDLGKKLKFAVWDRSRPQAVMMARNNVLSLQIRSHEMVAQDIRQFINDKLEDLGSRGEIPWQYHNMIEESLAEVSEGNFLQATLAWRHFTGGISHWSPQVIKTQLNNLRSLSREARVFYCSLLAQIPEDSQMIARLGFIWVLGSRKPLTLTELQHAVSISTMQRSWADLRESLDFNFDNHFEQAFGYLLRVDPDSRVRFAHSTVKELLTVQVDGGAGRSDESAVLSRFAIKEAEIDSELAKRCIIVLSFRDFVKLRDIAREAMADRMKDMFLTALQTEEALKSLNFAKYDEPDSVHDEDQETSERLGKAIAKLGQSGLDERTGSLFAYCVSYWNYHCSHGSSDPDVIKSLTKFALLRQSHYFLMVATLLGMAKYHQGELWNTIDQFSRLPPLHFVLKTGDHPQVLRNLIEQGQDINGVDCHGWTPLIWSLLEGRKESLELLLSYDETRLCDPGNGIHALHVALEARIDPDLIHRLLADPRVQVNARSHAPYHWTALQWCLSNSELQQVTDELLRRRDVEIYEKDRFGRNAIEQIFTDGLSETSALAVVTRSDVPQNWFEKPLGSTAAEVATSDAFDAFSEMPNSYIYRVASLGWDTVEDLILARAPPKAVSIDQDGLSLLERYAYHGAKQRLVRVLGKLPSYIFGVSQDWGARLLMYCSQQDWEDVANFLVHRFSADDIGQDSDGRTIIHWACELHWKSLPSLIGTKSKEWLNKTSNTGRTALHVAAEFRNELACVTLLQAGVSGNVRDRSGKLPIHIAAEHGHRSIVTVMLKYSLGEFSARGVDMDGRSILHYLAMWQTDAFIRKCLPSLRVHVDVRDVKGRSAMHYAAMFGNNHALSVLLGIGADLNLRDHSSLAPLHHALLAGSAPCVQTLLERGARYDSLDIFQRNIVLLAILSEDKSTVEYVARFLQSKVEPGDIKNYAAHTDCFGRSALHYLCHWTARPRLTVDDDLLDEATLEELTEDDGDTVSSNNEKIPPSSPVEWLIKTFVTLGADVNGCDCHEYYLTPLHTAAMTGNLAAAESLLRVPGVDPSPVDTRRCTPMDLAVVNGHKGVWQAIKNNGGRHSDNWKQKIAPAYRPWKSGYGHGDDEQDIMGAGVLALRSQGSEGKEAMD